MAMVGTVLAHVFSWPAAIVILAFIFRHSLIGLLSRVDRVKGAGIELSAPGGMAAQQAQVENKPVPQESLLGDAGLQRASPELNDLQRRQAAVRAFGGADLVVMGAIQSVEEELEQLQMPLASSETSAVLIRHLAVTQVLNRYERIYRLSFGSQLEALRNLNEAGSYTKVQMHTFYDKAASDHPSFYNDFAFESWLGFLRAQQVIWFENNVFVISVLGRDFLGWMVSNGLGWKVF